MQRKKTQRQAVLSIAFALPLITLIACTQTQETAQVTPATPSSAPTVTVPATVPPSQAPATGDLKPLFSHIWRVTTAPSQPAPGSIFVFLPNGTLLQTSCVETYAIAGWTIDKARPQVLQVSENGQSVYNAEILELTNTTLRLRRTLLPSNETQEVTFTAAEEQFTCPDLPR
ncbi:hypothetical protein [Leptolyngbya ohadii]|uniref:hypothetical protein n=1 Tax=Leptolyngbya ohadii TaxID=1962290 RepID=UPI00117ABE22|nr:hypothetical protein [Leptolyngbya ohadii]